MAHFAEIIDGKVARVLVIADRDTQDEASNEVEAIGAAYCNGLFGGEWVQTSYNGSFRGKYAGVGDEWDGDQFLSPIPQQPHPLWVLNGRVWEPPTPQPSEAHEWDNDLGQWVDATGKMDPASFALRFSATEQPRIQNSTDPDVQEVFEKLKSSPFVRPRSPVTVQAVAVLDAKGMLDHADRPAEILEPSPT